MNNLDYELESCVDTEHLAKQMQKIKEHPENYGKIPTHLGDIQYFDSTADDSPMSAQEHSDRIKKTLFITSGVAVVSFILGYFWIPTFYLFIFLDLIYLLYCLMTLEKFEGQDMFVCKDGFAICEFSEDRHNIKSYKEYKFEDVTMLTNCQIDNYNNDEEYIFTKYEVSLWKYDKDFNKTILLDSYEGKYIKGTGNTRRLMCLEYNFFEYLETYWSSENSKRLDYVMQTEGFAPIFVVGLDNKNNVLASVCYYINETSIKIADVVYDIDHITSLKIEKGVFYFEGTNPDTNEPVQYSMGVQHISNVSYFIHYIDRLREQIK